MMPLRYWLDFLFPPRTDEAIVRDISDTAFLALLAPQIVAATKPETAALFPFGAAAVRAAIHEAKYRGNERAFELLSIALVDYLHDHDETARRSAIVPVPLGKMRLKERGFNQTEKIAKRVAATLGISVDTTLLVRTRETVSQVSLPRAARKENMRGAFGAAHPADPSYTYIVIDDVITTGATLQAAIDALREAGAQHIIPLALAH
ncbi:MAG: amidophosphoribosyltransferase-like protein [Parcubacteria group bacterium Gr01-1014_49]|nr:MAG: amidophosphoribosyltransferase-like protein [Parcubacteria group bacterium Gr01-1014_49]